MPRDSAAPARNFTLTTEERVRAVVAGPPAYVRRLRTMEDLEEAILRLLASGQESQARWLLERLNELVSRHNRYYPVEADLAMDPRTGHLLERGGGKPWKPMPARSMDELKRRATA